MEKIELKKWAVSPKDPRQREYKGQRTAKEVFEELRHRLEIIGYLPDECFHMNSEWGNGRKIPRDAEILCYVGYGGSEGIYLDVALSWYENGRSHLNPLATGKTLGENGSDLDRMFLIASAITKAFHGDNATHARYMKIGGVEDDTGGSVLHLSQQEQQVVIDALVEQRERQEQAVPMTADLAVQNMFCASAIPFRATLPPENSMKRFLSPTLRSTPMAVSMCRFTATPR